MNDNVLYILDDSKQYVETGGETTEYSSNGQVFSWKKLKKKIVLDHQAISYFEISFRDWGEIVEINLYYM